MKVPKILFEPMTLDDNIDLVKFAYFEEDGLLSVHSYTLDMFPELANIDPNLSKKKKEKIVEDVVTEAYKKNEKNITRDVERYNKVWNDFNDDYMNALCEYLNIEFPKDVDYIHATVGVIPIFPRYLSSMSFSISIGVDNKKILETCAHETCHFLWFIKWKELYPKSKASLYESPSITWQYSEMVVDPILNSPMINEIIRVKEEAYGSFYVLKDQNNHFIMRELDKIFKEKTTIEERIKKGYEYIEEALKK